MLVSQLVHHAEPVFSALIIRSKREIILYRIISSLLRLNNSRPRTIKRERTFDINRCSLLLCFRFSLRPSKGSVFILKEFKFTLSIREAFQSFGILNLHRGQVACLLPAYTLRQNGMLGRLVSHAALAS